VLTALTLVVLIMAATSLGNVQLAVFFTGRCVLLTRVDLWGRTP